MTADIINLNSARKARERAGKAKRAAENSAKFGRTKAERQEARALEEMARKRHDALRLERTSQRSPMERPSAASVASAGAQSSSSRGQEPRGAPATEGSGRRPDDREQEPDE